jgi:hypothetical protein
MGCIDTAGPRVESYRELQDPVRQSQEKLATASVDFQHQHWKLFSKLKLLISLWPESKRTRDVLSATLSYDPSANDYPDLETMTPAELRRHLFFAMEQGADRLAFKILGRLNRADHNVGEVFYLEALCYFRANDFESAIRCVARIPSDAIDYPRGLIVALEASAILGRIDDTVSLLQRIGPSNLTPSQYFHAMQLLCANCDEPEVALKRNLHLLPDLNGPVFVDQDPAYPKWAEYHSELRASCSSASER